MTADSNPTVLVVDDDPALCGLIATVLQRRGWNVVTCGTAREAFDRLANESYPLVLLDILLPDGDGLDLLRQFAPLKPQTRFVIITADETSESVVRAIRGSAYDFMRKPFSPGQLADNVEQWLHAAAEPQIEVLSAKPEWIELSLPCSLPAADRIGNFLRSLKVDFPPQVRDEVSDCFRELLLNAVEWGGGLNPERRVRVSYLRTARLLMYRIADPGQGFRFDQIEHAAVGSAVTDPIALARIREEKGLRPGGLGLMIVRARADELLYNEAQNEVVFIKYLDKAADVAQ